MYKRCSFYLYFLSVFPAFYRNILLVLSLSDPVSLLVGRCISLLGLVSSVDAMQGGLRVAELGDFTKGLSQDTLKVLDVPVPIFSKVSPPLASPPVLVVTVPNEQNVPLRERVLEAVKTGAVDPEVHCAGSWTMRRVAFAVMVDLVSRNKPFTAFILEVKLLALESGATGKPALGVFTAMSFLHHMKAVLSGEAWQPQSSPTGDSSAEKAFAKALQDSKAESMSAISEALVDLVPLLFRNSGPGQACSSESLLQILVDKDDPEDLDLTLLVRLGLGSRRGMDILI